MPDMETAVPPIVSGEDWLVQRKLLLAHEKELTKQRDRVNAERRRLPMVRIEKDYVFDGPDGKQSLKDLFGERRQLIVYHFMFDPKWDEGCPGCTGFVKAMGDLSSLGRTDTAFVLISRAPIAKLETYKKSKGWSIPWYSSFGSDFNYDYHATFDESVAPIEHNYQTKAELIARRAADNLEGESQGFSVFFRVADEVFHTYSTYARGSEGIMDTYSLIDLTPYGRQESFEDSPPGWPQKPTYG